MGSTETTAAVRMRQPGFRIPLIHAFALATLGGLALLTAQWDRWNFLELGAIATFALVSDLMYVESGVTRVKISGVGLGMGLSAALLGGAPAALIGALAVGLGWFRSREAPHYLRNNVVTYAWCGFAKGVFFGGLTRFLAVGPNDAAYYFLVIPMVFVGIVVSFAGIVGYQCYLDGSSFGDKLRQVLVPVLSAELFSAVLTVFALYFVVKTGTIGIGVLLITLAIFQYLVGELLTSQRRAEELQRMATTDELTGLANRERFHAAVEEKLDSAIRTKSPFAVMLIDLDHFKEINDTLGHHYGDVLLRDLGPRLAACAGEGGLVARLGGDEFAVLTATRTDDEQELYGIAEELIARVQEPLVVDQMTLEVGASIGISRYPHDGDDASALLRRADIAMYKAKEGNADYKLYEAEMDRYSVRRLTVLSDFRRALKSEEFVVHYQPIVDVDGIRVRGAEGLVRWEHPEMGLVPPNDFIPIAEQSGLIGPLTRYVLEHAIAQCASWRRISPELTVSVNLSVRDLLDRALPAEIERMLALYGLPPEALKLEVTESMIMSDPDRALETATTLRDGGMRISVDDFGTGYSSLATSSA